MKKLSSAATLMEVSVYFNMKQAEKLKSREMKDEGWKLNDESWKMKVERWRLKNEVYE